MARQGAFWLARAPATSKCCVGALPERRLLHSTAPGFRRSRAIRFDMLDAVAPPPLSPANVSFREDVRQLRTAEMGREADLTEAPTQLPLWLLADNRGNFSKGPRPSPLRLSDHVARDDELLDLGRALVDAEQADVAVEALHAVLRDVAGPAVDLHGPSATLPTISEAYILQQAASVATSRPASLRRAVSSTMQRAA
jgi:hypothetical protein